MYHHFLTSQIATELYLNQSLRARLITSHHKLHSLWGCKRKEEGSILWHWDGTWTEVKSDFSSNDFWGSLVSKLCTTFN
jgi:hypothetical protein